MTGNSMDLAQDQIVLDSHLSEMARVPAWVEALATQHGFSERVKFAANLCLEEALSNVIRHGYAQQNGWVTVHFHEPSEAYFVFTIEDHAPSFNPLAQELKPTIGQQAPDQIGGQGIRLMRGFADSLEYESTPTGNRLHIGFANAPSTK